MSISYEQEFTITLSQQEATSLVVALEESLSSYREKMGDASLLGAHPTSCIGNIKELLDEMRRAQLGHKNTSHVAYKMIRIGRAA